MLVVDVIMESCCLQKLVTVEWINIFNFAKIGGYMPLINLIIIILYTLYFIFIVS